MSLKFAVTGSTGLIGSAICTWLIDHGHTVTRLVRRNSKTKKNFDNSMEWDFKQKKIDLEKLEGHDAVLNLAGASISGQRWTGQYKNEIYKSRVDGTSFLSESLAKLKRPPKVFFSGSAIGYYGHHPDGEIIDETGTNGQGFLAKVTHDWELATKPAELSGIRTIQMRTGVVLDRHGGALAKMLPPFYFGLGGPIGSGQQVMSWISLGEIPPIIYFLTQKKEVRGPINLTAPQPVTSRDFARILGKVIHRPAFLPLPEFAVSLIFGEMGRELLLSGSRVIPRRLRDLGYEFTYPDLPATLNFILK